jgi:hypothetical protein
VGDIVVIKENGKESTVVLPKIEYPKPADELLTATVKDLTYTITCAMPTISREAQLEKELRSKLTSSELNSYEDVRNVLADAYIGELAKHITHVSVGGTEIDVGTLGFANAYSVIERLPATAIKGVVTYMESIQKYLSTLRTFTDNTTSERVEVTVDAAFFATK